MQFSERKPKESCHCLMCKINALFSLYALCSVLIVLCGLLFGYVFHSWSYTFISFGFVLLPFDYTLRRFSFAHFSVHNVLLSFGNELILIGYGLSFDLVMSFLNMLFLFHYSLFLCALYIRSF